jgi:hypothetical protein
MQHMWCTAGGLEHVYVQQAVQWCQLATQQYSWLRLLACTVTLTLAGEWLTGAGSCAAPAPAPAPIWLNDWCWWHWQRLQATRTAGVGRVGAV